MRQQVTEREPWQDLFEYWMSLVVPSQPGGRHGRAHEFHSSAVFPLVVQDIARLRPELTTQRQRAGRLADYIRNTWAPTQPVGVLAGLSLLDVTSSDGIVSRDALIRRITKACRRKPAADLGSATTPI